MVEERVQAPSYQYYIVLYRHRARDTGEHDRELLQNLTCAAQYLTCLIPVFFLSYTSVSLLLLFIYFYLYIIFIYLYIYIYIYIFIFIYFFLSIYLFYTISLISSPQLLSVLLCLILNLARGIYSRILTVTQRSGEEWGNKSFITSWACIL